MKLTLKNKISRFYNLLLPPPNNNKRLIFIHIPKSAGSSLTQSISDLYRNPLKPWRNETFHLNPKTSADIANFYNTDLLSEREKISLYAVSEKYKFIAGHFGYSPLLKKFSQNKYMFFTILRNPVDRFISEYFYNFHKQSDHFKIKLELDKYLDSEAAYNSARTYLHYLGISSNGYNVNKIFSIENARINIQDIDMIATLDDFNSSISNLRNFLGRNFHIPHLNSNPAEGYLDRINTNQLKKIKNLCSIDQEIYEYAKKIQLNR